MTALDLKVSFLSRPESYPDCPRRVETRETHMSWIFLTDTDAWKLKKPSYFDHLDLRSTEARRRNCDEEVRLNRRLASDVYRGVVPLTVRSGNVLQLGKSGIVDDWLVCMRRLPSDRMLDNAIAKQTWSTSDAQKVGALLAQFYSNAAPLPLSAQDYMEHLENELQSSREELTRHEPLLSTKLITSTISNTLGFIKRHPHLFSERVLAGKIVEGHGDLRPEHICLEEKPVIIDCLEFNRNLRIADPISELMFLKLECERLGAPAAGDLVLETYCKRTGDHPSAELLAFCRKYHAAVRAKVAIWHLQDHTIRGFQKWIDRAQQYLVMAA